MVKWSLFIAASGFAGFLAAPVLSLFGLAALGEQTARISSAIFLSSLLILFLTGAGLFLKRFFSQLAGYLSANRALERKSLFFANEFRKRQRIFEFKKAKMLYLAQQKRKRVFRKWSRRNAV